MANDHSELETTANRPHRPSGQRKWFGVTGLALGLVALVCSIVAYHVLEEPAQASRSTLTVDLGFVKWKRETAPPPPEPDLGQWVTPFQLRLAAISVGIVATILGIISWWRREGFWLGFGACTFAAAAIAWVWFIVAFALLALSGGLFVFTPAFERAASVSTSDS
jgi:hypothetical protein